MSSFQTEKPHQNKLLAILGVGIKTISHVTREAQAHIEKSEKILYLVNEPVIEKWICNINNSSESLEHIYNKYSLRNQAYNAISERILESLETNNSVCAVFYGHPLIACQPAHGAIKKAKQLNYTVKVLPGIATDSCLFADLGIDPASSGWQSFEATDFLASTRSCDIHSHLILWQVGTIGVTGHAIQYDNRYGATLLRNHLLNYYSPEHVVTLYHASLYPGLESEIIELTIQNLPDAKFNTLSTLYIPPSSPATRNKEMMIKLGLSPPIQNK